MSVETTTARPSEQQLRERSPWAIVPSWLLSLMLHTTLLVFLATRLWAPAPKDAHEGEDGGFREIGIVVKSDEPPSESLAESESQQSEETSPDSATDALATPTLADSASLPLALPEVDPLPILGAGAIAPPVGIPRDVGDFAQPNGLKPSAGAPGIGTGATSFYGINDNAAQVVYVVDCSASMDGAPLIEAKARLVQSLQQLENTQRFQIIFYNNKVHPMALSGSAEGGLFWATDINKTQARQFVSSRPASGGTDHMPALEMALKLSPDVLYFLSDAQDGLNSRQMNRLRTLTKGTRIHCIEFGEGPELRNYDSFLEQLAREHNGNYTYRDTTRIE